MTPRAHGPGWFATFGIVAAVFAAVCLGAALFLWWWAEQAAGC